MSEQEGPTLVPIVAPPNVERKDYWLPFEVPPGLMPDPYFDEREATLHVQRIRPVYGGGTSLPAPPPVVVLIHGRTVPGPVVFDLREPGTGGGALSVQEVLARAGIDTFAPSLLGYGKSTRFDKGLDDPGNASLRPYSPPPGSTDCPYPEGCDRTLLPGINPLDQQGTMLLVNPFAELTGGVRRKHSIESRFARTDVWVRDIDQVINKAIGLNKENYAGPDERKVTLVGYSVGGEHVGRTLYANNPLGGHQLEQRAAIIDKVSRVVFVNSLFRPQGLPEDPNLGLPTFPLTLNDRLGSDVNWRMLGEPLGCEGTSCSGHIIPGTQEQVWCQTLEQETLGLGWGGDDARYPTGLNRAPTFSGYGWNNAVAGQLSKPTLVIQGLKDTGLPAGPDTGGAIYAALHKGLHLPPESMPNKVLVQVECASHALVWEGCAGDRCRPAPGTGTPYGGPPGRATWAGPHATLKAALIEWITSETFNDARSGSFIIDQSGVVSQEH